MADSVRDDLPASSQAASASGTNGQMPNLNMEWQM